MARPISWLPRLHVIRRSVANSVRSHYSSRDLGLLFKLQPRAVTKLLKVLPVVLVGQAHMVQREDLVDFLDRVQQAENVTALCIQRRVEKGNVSRKKPRALVLREFEPIDPASLAPWISRGVLKETPFTSVQQLADIFWRIACAMDGEGLEEFIRLYEPEQLVSEEREQQRAEKQAIDEEIERMDAMYKAANFTPNFTRRPPSTATEAEAPTGEKVSA